MEHTDYVLNEDALSYMEKHGLSRSRFRRLKHISGKTFNNKDELNDFFHIIGIKKEKEVRIVTEGLLIASILSHGINEDIIIVSDDAGQFNVLLHALCWIHAERRLNEIIPINDYQREIIVGIRKEVWNLYSGLKEYKISPSFTKKIVLYLEFDRIFKTITEFEVVNKALQSIYENKKGLLMVLDRPEIPLNNNTSENDVRIIVRKRRVHGGTRSEDGRMCRDTFMSLKKTCLKMGISFQEYLYDRITGANIIPSLHEILKEKSLEGT